MSEKRKFSWTDADAKEVLARYEAFVQRTALRLRPSALSGQALDHDDLCAEGRVAVLEALATYEGFGVAEHTWVRTRIRQRMIDAIRRLDVKSRKETRLVVQHQQTPLGEEPSKDAAHTVVARRLVPLDAEQFDHQLRANVLHSFIEPHSPEEHLLRKRLLEALKELPERQRQAMELALTEGLSLSDIGLAMGISESRVCQLQKIAIRYLQKSIANSMLPSP